MKKKTIQAIDFLGIGAPKSGTTWIDACLDEHPQIHTASVSGRKELAFFNDANVWQDNSIGRVSYYSRGIDWYLKQFPPAKKGYIRGEFCILYLADPVACRRIKKHFPDIKLIAVLRNPMDMIYSLHWYLYNGAVLKISKDVLVNIKNKQFVEQGFYAKHLSEYYKHFPRKNIKVIIFKEMNEDPAKAVSEIYKFLGVDKNYVPKLLNKSVNSAFQTRSKLLKDLAHLAFISISNFGGERLKLQIFESKILFNIYSFINKKPFKYPPMSDEIRLKLYEIYKEDISNLEKLLNKDLSFWKPN